MAGLSYLGVTMHAFGVSGGVPGSERSSAGEAVAIFAMVIPTLDEMLHRRA